MKKILISVFVLAIVLLPVLTFAQFVGPCPQGTYNDGTGCAPADGFAGILLKIHRLLNYLIPILVTLGIVYFVWGVVQYVIGGGEEAKTQGRDKIIYGLIGFAVIFGFWGLVNIVMNTFDIDAAAPELEAITVGSDTNCAITNSSKLQDVLCYVTNIINNSIIPLLFAVATVFFIWGAIKFFIINSEEEASREQGKQFMLWSIIALTVMLSIWGLVAILGGTFGINTSVLPQVRP